MIEPLQLVGDVRDGAEVAKINEIISAINQSATSSHPHLVKVERNEGGLIFDFSGLVNALERATGARI